MEAYKRWVRRNKDHLQSLDSLANSMTWVLPDRFSDSEITPEAVTSIVDIITAINNHIIKTAPDPTVDQPEPSSSPYTLCITLIKGLETLVEVAAQQYYGDDKKWNFIATTEAIKVFVRLAMLHNSGYQMLLHGGESVYVKKSFGASNGQYYGFHNLRYYDSRAQMNLEGRALPTLTWFGEDARMAYEPTWLHRVQLRLGNPSAIEEKHTLSTLLSEQGIPGGLFVMGEMMFIIRPLLYVLLIRKYGTRSWFPWFTSLAVDLIGNGMIHSYFTKRLSNRKGPYYHFPYQERDELRRRRLLFVLYLMRDPFFTDYTRNRLDRTQTSLESVPVVGFFADKLIELLIGAQTRYTYMSGS